MFFIRHFRFLLAAGVFLFQLSVYAQKPLQQYDFNQLTIKDGLSHGLVNAFCQDAEGFLWIGTFDGLDRFDGKNFKVFKYNRKNLHSLPNNVIHDLCVDKEDNIWGFTQGGVFRYMKSADSFDIFHLVDDSSHASVDYGEGTILCDRQGDVYVGVVGGLFQFIPQKKEFKHYRSYAADSTTLPSNSIRKHSMVEDKTRQGLWIGTTRGGGMCYFDTKTKIAYSRKNNPQHLALFDNHRIFPVCLTNDNKVVYGDNSDYELCYYDIGRNVVARTKKMMQENRNNFPTETATIFCDSKNNLWITTWAYHFWRVDGVTGEADELFHDETNPKSINSTFCWDVFEDKEGTLWFGGVKGISYFNPEKVFYTIYRPDLRFPILKINQIIECFYEDKNDLLWFGTKGAGLFSYDFKTDTYINYSYEENSGNKADFHNTVISFVRTGDEFWLGTNAGIMIFNTVTKKFRKFTPSGTFKSIDSSYIYSMALQSDSVIWFGDYTNGLSRLNTLSNTIDQWMTLPDGREKLDVRNSFSIVADAKSDIWVSGYYNKWIRFKAGEKSFSTVGINPKDSNALPAQPVSKIAMDENGNYWVMILGQGLARYNPATGETKTWNSSDGLAFDPSGALAKDKFGRLWIAGYNLLSVFEPKTSKFENYYIEYAESDYNYGNCLITLHNGKIVSGMLGAFVVFDPVKQERRLPLRDILVSNFRVFEKSIPFSRQSSEISLSYRENFFSFDYSVPTGVEYDKIEYSYLLEGFDRDWVNAGRRQSAAYTNVPGGDYLFKARARSRDGEWTEPKTLATIHISKIFYQTWWFRFLVAVFMFLLIRVYVRFRNRQQKREEAENAITYFANSEYTNSSPEEILWDLARNCISRLGFVDCVIYLVDEEHHVLVQKAALGEKTPDEKTILNPLEIPVGKGIVGSVAATGKTELVNDTSKDPRYITDDASRLSEIAVPILFDGKAIGVIDSEHPRRNFFNEEHRRILETIASICATKIVNAMSSQELAEKEKKLLEIDKKVAEVRLMALRAQMNPHFIFNCLNAIDNYILKNDVQNASMYLNKFARLIRTILAESDKNYVSLKSELELLKNYIELENLRFEEKFLFKLEVDTIMDAAEIDIPPMLIQPFVENAIVHGLIHKKGEKILSINIHSHDDHLSCVITDNGIGRKEAQRIKDSKTQTHESKGMRVTEGRLELLQQQVKEKGSVSITDLEDSNGNPAGTSVEILIPVEEE